ncbi:hypothetical protein B0H13DRAFT_1933663 [Mycena leptocephala]|nr:hypothetical protein B0H13DRAFT_1933663 [Mycena leptocephala]
MVPPQCPTSPGSHPTRHSVLHDTALHTRERAFMRALLHADYVRHPDEPFLVDFDYSGPGDVAVERTDDATCDACRTRPFVPPARVSTSIHELAGGGGPPRSRLIYNASEAQNNSMNGLISALDYAAASPIFVLRAEIESRDKVLESMNLNYLIISTTSAFYTSQVGLIVLVSKSSPRFTADSRSLAATPMLGAECQFSRLNARIMEIWKTCCLVVAV